LGLPVRSGSLGSFHVAPLMDLDDRLACTDPRELTRRRRQTFLHRPSMPSTC